MTSSFVQLDMTIVIVSRYVILSNIFQIHKFEEISIFTLVKRSELTESAFRRILTSTALHSFARCGVRRHSNNMLHFFCHFFNLRPECDILLFLSLILSLIYFELWIVTQRNDLSEPTLTLTFTRPVLDQFHDSSKVNASC